MTIVPPLVFSTFFSFGFPFIPKALNFFAKIDHPFTRHLLLGKKILCLLPSPSITEHTALQPVVPSIFFPIKDPFSRRALLTTNLNSLQQLAESLFPESNPTHHSFSSFCYVPLYLPSPSTVISNILSSTENHLLYLIIARYFQNGKGLGLLSPPPLLQSIFCVS